jgi:hypothetical protein
VHSRRAVPTRRSAYEFARGACGGVSITSAPASARTASNAPVYLASRSRISNRERPARLLQVRHEVARALRHPRPAWVPGHPQDMDAASGDLEAEEPLHLPQPHRVHGEEVHRQNPRSLSTQERRPGLLRPSRRGVDTSRAQDPPHRGASSPPQPPRPAPRPASASASRNRASHGRPTQRPVRGMIGHSGRVLRGTPAGNLARPAIQEAPLQGDNEHVRSRYLAIGAAIWAAGYAGIYAAVITGQGNSPAWWYLALLAAGAGSLAVAATRRWPRPALIFGAACLALAALAGSCRSGWSWCQQWWLRPLQLREPAHARTPANPPDDSLRREITPADARHVSLLQRGIRLAHVPAPPSPEVDRWLVALLVLWEGEERSRQADRWAGRLHL